MHSDLLDIGWTEDHWNRIYAAVTEEAQRARVAAQFLSVVGPLDPTTVAIPSYTLTAPRSPKSLFSAETLAIDSDPTLFLTRISVNVQLRGREAKDPELTAALTMFRRAANYVARIEDALVFNGRPGPNLDPPFGIAGIPAVHRISGGGEARGLFSSGGTQVQHVRIASIPSKKLGDQVIGAIIETINNLDASGQLGPYACVLSPALFAAVCAPNDALVLPRDRILPFLQGPLLRSSAVQDPYGVIVALSANPVELVVGRDIRPKFLLTTEEARLVFQVSEKVALRVKEPSAIGTFS